MILALVLIALVCSIFAPLSTYIVSVALFSVPHVIAEFCYFRERLKDLPRCDSLNLKGLVILLFTTALIAALARAASNFLPEDLAGAKDFLIHTSPFIVAFGTSLVLLKLSALAWVICSLAVVVLYTYHYSTTAILTLAFIHNLVPFIFVYERRQVFFRNKKVIFLGSATILFWILFFLSSFSIKYDSGFGFPTWNLGTLIGHYTPRAWVNSTMGVKWFSLAVFLQCIHYFSTIFLLPSTLEKHETQRIYATTFGVGLIALGLYLFDFFGTRNFYTPLAAFHVALEWPILAIMIVGFLWKPKAKSDVSSQSETVLTFSKVREI